MPKSKHNRNRIKPVFKKQKKVIETITEQIQKCPKCLYERHYCEFEELPEVYKLDFKKERNFLIFDFYLYCPSCLDYTSVFFK